MWGCGRAWPGAHGTASLAENLNIGCYSLRGEKRLTSPSGPRVDSTGLSASGLLLGWLHWQRPEVGVISPARGLQRQDVLGEPFVEPGPRPLPDLGGGDTCLEHRMQSGPPYTVLPCTPSLPSWWEGGKHSAPWASRKCSMDVTCLPFPPDLGAE